MLSSKLLSSHIYNGSSPNATDTWYNKINQGRLNQEEESPEYINALEILTPGNKTAEVCLPIFIC